MSRDADALDAVLGLLEHAVADGLISPQHRQAVLERTGGDFEAWIGEPDEVRLAETLRLLQAATSDLEMTEPLQKRRTYSSTTRATPGRADEHVARPIPIGGPLTAGAFRCLDAVLETAASFLTLLPGPEEHKAQALRQLLDKRLGRWLA